MKRVRLIVAGMFHALARRIYPYMSDSGVRTTEPLGTLEPLDEKIVTRLEWFRG